MKCRYRFHLPAVPDPGGLDLALIAADIKNISYPC